jgi:hypothetical protein
MRKLQRYPFRYGLLAGGTCLPQRAPSEDALHGGVSS